ncbi:radical SAM-linked protein [Motilibacter rhizosphaerae]|uniref:Radical SAM-linked protein n=1 Tax=Motilibacter rhizosphaerae TaxID=598652 RepID=A0A4Q7NRS1_9ACTN|nr:TIGR03936 family radical SAM-associated protein [Motilibacter rhizosphaerae]RZS89777.1 radical SAM-linked protein [Motilibacter rhizosphaerae]
MARTPDGPPPPPAVQKLRVRWAKRGRLRFTSHRDFQRAFERAVRRAGLPVAYSAGFSPHPKISYAGAAPTGTASEAEYVEVSVTTRVDPAEVARLLDAAMPPGLDVLEVVEAAPGAGSLADRLQASHWRIELPGTAAAQAEEAVAAFLASPEVLVERLTKDGTRTFDARGAVLRLSAGSEPEREPCAILHVVVRHGTPTVRPDDVLSGLRRTGILVTPAPPVAVRLAQGPLDEPTGEVGDPLAPDRNAVGAPLAVGGA